jgi:hypothetical protein
MVLENALSSRKYIIRRKPYFSTVTCHLPDNKWQPILS